jgi:hypothetical protein
MSKYSLHARTGKKPATLRYLSRAEEYLVYQVGTRSLAMYFCFRRGPHKRTAKGPIHTRRQQGLNTGVLPDPGFTYALTKNYSADTLKNSNGNSVPLAGSYDIWAIENSFFRSSNSWAQSLRLWLWQQRLPTAP